MTFVLQIRSTHGCSYHSVFQILSFVRFLRGKTLGVCKGSANLLCHHRATCEFKDVSVSRDQASPGSLWLELCVSVVRLVRPRVDEGNQAPHQSSKGREALWY